MKKDEKSRRPYVICLMVTSLDGKILAEKWGDTPTMNKLAGKFEIVQDRIGIPAWIVGRTTMEKDFTEFAKPILKKGHQEISREDFVAVHHAKRFAITIDGSAKLGWSEPKIGKDHVITILTESVPDAYLAHLKDIGLSYVFAGKTTINLTLALEKLYSLFGIENLMLEGGGKINGAFLNEGLIDEVNQVILPIADGTIETSTMFEIDALKKKDGATLMSLQEVKKIEDDAVWLTYKVVGRE